MKDTPYKKNCIEFFMEFLIAVLHFSFTLTSKAINI